MKSKQEEQKEMVGGCCVCSDENGWAENPLVYCDGQGCNVAVHQACYGIVTVPTGSWFCRKCESQERSARVRCELCPSKDGALKRTDSGGWAHVVCALYIPEVRFGNVTTMEPIMLQLVPPERFNKICYICDAGQKGSATSNRAQMGACMQCNRQGCKNNFHVTCAQSMGLLCEEAGNYLDNVKYCGYCSYHFEKLQNTFQKKGSTVKTIPPYRPVNRDSDYSDEESSSKVAVIGENKEKQSGSGTEGNSDDLKDKHKKRSKILSGLDSKIRDIKPNISDLSSSSKDTTSLSDSTTSENNKEQNTSALDKSSSNVVMPITVKSEPKNNNSGEPSHSSLVPNFKLSGSSVTKYSTSSGSISSSETVSTTSSTPSASSSTFLADPVIRPSVLDAGGVTSSDSVTSSLSLTSITASSHSSTTLSLSSESSHGKGIVTTLSSSSNSRTKNSLPLSSFSQDKNREKDKDSFPTTSETSTIDKEKDKQRKIRRNASKSSITTKDSDDISMSTEEDSPTKESTLNIREEKNLGVENRDRGKYRNSSEDSKLNVQFTPNVSATSSRMDTFAEFSGIVEASKRSRSNSQDKNRRSKRGGNGGGSNNSATTKRSRTFREMKESPPSSPESFTTTETPPKKSRLNKKSESKESIISNGLSSNALLLGNQINPASSMARKMADTLHAELEAHSIYKEDDKISTGLIGPILPGKRENSSSGNVLNSSQPPPLPQSLEQLLERQWEQGSQFLMEQAQHFDIASLLSCLHQLRQENVRLEETVNSLVARRDHLLAVNARLSVPLNTTPSSTSGTSLATTTSTVTIASTLSANQPPPSTSLVSITPTGPPAVSASVVLGGHPSSQLAQHPGGNTRPHSAGRHPSGGSAAHITMTSTQGGRGGSPHDRRGGPQQVTPLENGLGESDYRYHRQQSPMLPPAAQPSQTSLRHSPASINYQSGSSPHSVVPSLSPSNISHPISSHTLVAHSAPHGGGHAPIMVSSSHGPPHSVSLARGSDHSRAELVRLSSQAPPPHGVATYPIYQMVSPPVHHSPVAISQHPPPSHTQVMRRETVDSGRANHSSLEKR